MAEVSSVVLGDADCPLCGKPTVVKAMKNGRAIITCTYPPEGCGHQLMSRSDVSTQLMIGRIKKWRSPELRAKFLGAPAPAKSNPPASLPAPESNSPTLERKPKASSPKSMPRSASPKPPAAKKPETAQPKSLWQKFVES